MIRPHFRAQSAWELARSMVIGYIDEEEEDDTDAESEPGSGSNTSDQGEHGRTRDEWRPISVARRRNSTSNRGRRRTYSQSSVATTSVGGDIGSSTSDTTSKVANPTVAAIARAWVRSRCVLEFIVARSWKTLRAVHLDEIRCQPLAISPLRCSPSPSHPLASLHWVR